mgnify:CR=1 FL=1
MNANKVFLLIGGFIVYLLVQILVLKNLVLFGTAFCFLYVLYLLLLPIETKLGAPITAANAAGIAVPSHMS